MTEKLSLGVKRGVFLIFALFLIAGLIVWKGMIVVPLFIFILALWWFSKHLAVGWYILVALSPMTHWIIYLNHFRFITENFPFLKAVYAPAVEFWTLFMLLAFALRWLRIWLGEGRAEKVMLPGVWFFLLFVLSGLISLINIAASEVNAGGYYLLRYIIFFYLGYLVLGVNIVNKEKILRRSFVAFAITGLFAASMGLVSLFNGAWQIKWGGAFRVTPFPVLGWAPFGDQHIFLAEILIVTLPILAYFWYSADSQKKRRRLAAAILFVLLIALLTFSRAAWVTIVFGVVLLGYLYRREINLKRRIKKIILPALLFLPVIIYFVYFAAASPIVASSTLARWQLAEISLNLFQNHPLLGNGVGSFVNLVGEIWIYQFEFGEPADAHGLVQKILAEQGLFGLIAFILFAGWIARRLFIQYGKSRPGGKDRALSLAGVFLFFSAVIFQLFNTQYYSSQMWTPIALALASYFLARQHWENYHPTFIRK